jgi:hypothetical protein
MAQSSVAPSPTDHFALRPSRVAAQFRHLPVEIHALLRLCDGTRNLAELRNASRMPTALFDSVLRKLRTLGLIEPYQRPMRIDRARVIAWANNEPPVTFSDDEEEFFGRTIDHLLEPEERTATP